MQVLDNDAKVYCWCDDAIVMKYVVVVEMNLPNCMENSEL